MHDPKESRKRPTLKQIAAAAVAQLLEIPHEHAKQMTEDQVLSLVNVDHYPVPFARARDLGWSSAEYNHFSNLYIRRILEHREKSATVDTPEHYKSERISEAHEQNRRKLLAKAGRDAGCDVANTRTTRTSKLRSRPFPRPPEGHKWWGKR